MAQSKLCFPDEILSIPKILFNLTAASCDPIHIYDVFTTGKEEKYRMLREWKCVHLTHNKMSDYAYDFQKIANMTLGSCQSNKYSVKNDLLSAQGESIYDGRTVGRFFNSMKNSIITVGTKQEIESAIRNVPAKGKRRIYKTDLESSDCGPMINLGDIDNPLKRYRETREPCMGVNKQVLLIGSAFTISPIHVEDNLFASINTIIYGEGGKLWIIVHPSDNERLESAIKATIGENATCFFLRNKCYAVTLKFLEENHIRYIIQHQKVGEMLIIGANIYHQIINTGRNVACAINVIPTQHIQPIFKYEPCKHKPLEKNQPRGTMQHGQNLSHFFPNLTTAIYEFIAEKVQGVKRSVELEPDVTPLYEDKTTAKDPHVSNKCRGVFSKRVNAVTHYNNICSETKRKELKITCEICDLPCLKRNLNDHKKNIHVPRTYTDDCEDRNL